MPALLAGLAGLVFALGLGLGGMVQPEKVLGFLDVAGAWDPSLAFVMGGALVTHGVLRRWILRRSEPVFGGTFPMKRSLKADPRVLAGSALFGIGWGLAGYCPGPALTALGSGAPSALLFGAALVAGMGAHSWLFRTRNTLHVHPPLEPSP